MKKAFAILTAAIVLLSSMSNAILYAGFKLNQVEIERLYCVNKRKPKLNCHGKCHLKKQLAANNEKGTKPSPKNSLEETYKLNFFYLPMPLLNKAMPSDLANIIGTNSPIPPSRIFGNSLFQPPDHSSFIC